MDALLGIDQHGAPRPVPLVANPDFHDGQVLIDPETRTVTLLDFGQAVPISNDERRYAADLLGIVGRAHTPASAARILNGRLGTDLTPAELAPILAGKDAMDTFVRLVGFLAGRGKKVPLPVVHWVLGINRQRALGERIGQPVEPTLRNLVLTRRLGLPEEVPNALHLAASRASLSGLLPGPLGAALRFLLG
ncbi:MAG: hypothetical protein AB1758_05840 [Candidatus Eremiobacterota bacterium]